MSSPPRHPRHHGEAGSNGDGQRNRRRLRLEPGTAPFPLLSFDGYEDAAELQRAERLANPPAPTTKPRTKNTRTFLERDWANVPWKDLLGFAKGFGGFSWLSAGTKSGQADYTCGTHESRETRLRVVQRGAGGALFSNGVPHSAQFSTAPHKGRGVGGEFVSEIRGLSAIKHGAKYILLEIRAKYGARAPTMDKAKYDRIPSLASIQSFLAYNCTTSSFNLCNAELLAMCANKRVLNWADVQTHGQGEMLVCGEFCRQVQVTVHDAEGSPTGETQRETSLGVIFASRKQLEWTRRFYIHLQALEALPTPPPAYFWVVQADGTYKLVKGSKASGAVLVDLGIHDVKCDSGKDKDVHTFIPLLYMYVQVECFEAYEALFQTFRHLPTTHLGLPGCQIRPEYGSLDRAAYIAMAFAAVWPEVTYEETY